MGEWFGLEVVDSDLDSGYSQQSTKRKRNTDSETCRKRKRCHRIVIYDSSESENENDKCDTHTDSDSGVNGNEVENDTDTHTDSDSGVNKNGENESSKETENDGESSEKEKSSGPNETDSDSCEYESSESDSCEESSHRKTDSDIESETNSNALTVDTESENEGNEADIDKLKSKTIHSGSKVTYKCPVCNFKCPSSGHVYVHMVSKIFDAKDVISVHWTKLCFWTMLGVTAKNRGLKPKHFLTKRKVPKCQVKNPKQKLVCNQVFFFCQYCDHFGKSSGIVFAHMCEKHGIEPFKCSKCKFSTGNKTSFYKHITRFCR